MATVKKVKKAQKGSSVNPKFKMDMDLNELKSAIKRSGYKSSTEKSGFRKLPLTTSDSAKFEKLPFRPGKDDAKMERYKKGGKVKKAQVGYKLLPGQKRSSVTKPVNNYDNGPIIGGNKQLPLRKELPVIKRSNVKKPATDLKKKNESENSGIRKSSKSAFDSVSKYSKDTTMKRGGTMKKKMKTGGTLSPSKKSVGKTIGKLNKAKYGSKTSKKK